jgi:hypothetical protein
MGSFRDFLKRLTASITPGGAARALAKKAKEERASKRAPRPKKLTKAVRGPTPAQLARATEKNQRSMRALLAKQGAKGASVLAVAEHALKRPSNESPAKAVERLERFATTTVRAKWKNRLTVSGFAAPGKEAVRAAFKKRSVRPSSAVLDVLAHAAGLRIRGRGLEVDISSLKDLDYDRWGRSLENPRYANVFGYAARGFVAARVEPEFLRLALCRYAVPDEAFHEDGDVAALFVPLVGRKAGEPAVWEIPHDDGYEHVVVAPDAATWLSVLVDRLIRCTSLLEAGVELEPTA